jgi:hypothetical protein
LRGVRKSSRDFLANLEMLAAENPTEALFAEEEESLLKPI